MPIAHCFVNQDNPPGQQDIARIWARESGMDGHEMTVNIITSQQQYGKAYAVMAHLLLPTAWSPAAVCALQTGLARALSISFALPARQVHVITTRVDSGLVVEDGQVQPW